MRILLDTNVLISALIFGGVPQNILEHAIARTFQLITSPILLDELDEKLSTKFQWPHTRVTENRRQFENLCDVVSTIPHLQVIQDDPDDDRVLECAVAGRADYIVSGDKHLLKLGEFRGIPVLTVRQFLDLIAPPI